MLNLDKLLYKLISTIGSEPIRSPIYSSAPPSFAVHGGRVAVGISSDGNTCWTVTALSSSSSTSQHYLVETYSQFTVKYSDVPESSTSGGFYYAYFDVDEDSYLEEDPVYYNFYCMATADLSDLIEIGGTTNLLCRTAFGSATTYANTGTTSTLHSDLTMVNDGEHLRFQAHRVGNSPSNLSTFCYVVSLWEVTSPDVFL